MQAFSSFQTALLLGTAWTVETWHEITTCMASFGGMIDAPAIGIIIIMSQQSTTNGPSVAGLNNGFMQKKTNFHSRCVATITLYNRKHEYL